MDNDPFETAASQAVEHWGIEAKTVELIAMSENAVFRVDPVAGPPVIVRLHRPGYNTEAQLESELGWVDSLHLAGIDTPAVILTPTGSGYMPVKVGDEVRQAGVIEWIDGHALSNILADDPSQVSTSYQQLGAVMARMHQHSETWEVPNGFDRRRWDADGLVGPDPLWGRFWEVGSLSTSQRDLLTRAQRRLYEHLAGLSTDPGSFGLIHSDLHLGNVLAGDNRLVVIDFDDSGWGWYLYDLAVALKSALDEPWFDQARTSIIDGYRTVRSLSNQDLDLIPTLLTVRCLITVGWLDARPELGLGHELSGTIDTAVAQAETYLERVGG